MDNTAVLDIAMNAYWQADPVDISVNKICQLAGISKPSLYRTFGSEDGLKSAALDRYAAQVLSQISAILLQGANLRDTLDALIEFTSTDPRMTTGCLFYKMRSGKHRLGPKALAKVDQIDAVARAVYGSFLQARRDAGDWPGPVSVELGAKYLSEQIALAFTHRASGLDTSAVRQMLDLSLSIFQPVASKPQS